MPRFFAALTSPLLKLTTCQTLILPVPAKTWKTVRTANMIIVDTREKPTSETEGNKIRALIS